MDEILVYIVLFIIYLVAQALGAKKKKQQRPVPDTDNGAPRTLTLEEALREIRTAMGEPGAPTRAEPPPPPKPTLPPRGPRPVQPRPTPPRPITQATPRPVRRPSISETPSIQRPVQHLKERPAPPTMRKRLSSTVLNLLRDPGAARNAVILSEILGPPRSRR